MSFFDFKPKEQSKFIIFTVDALDEQDEAESAITFTSLQDLEFHQSTRIAYEPLEQGQFTSDSIIGSPFEIKLRASYTPFATKKDDTRIKLRKTITDVVNDIETFQQNDKLLVLFDTYPILKIYENIKITDFSYKQTDEINCLVANLTLQQVRLSDVDFESLNDKNLANQENSSTKDDGAVEPMTVTDTLDIA